MWPILFFGRGAWDAGVEQFPSFEPHAWIFGLGEQPSSLARIASPRMREAIASWKLRRFPECVFKVGKGAAGNSRQVVVQAERPWHDPTERRPRRRRFLLP